MAEEENKTQETIEELEYEEEEDIVDEVNSLKERIENIEKEIKDLSKILKNTVLDVRNLISEIDNPFSFLKTIGVDKLVDKAMETAEEEVSKAKREKLKDAVKKDPNKDKPKVIAATISSGNSSSRDIVTRDDGNNGRNITYLGSNNGGNSKREQFPVREYIPGANAATLMAMKPNIDNNGEKSNFISQLLKKNNYSIKNYSSLISSRKMIRLVIIASFIVLRYGTKKGLELINDYIVEGIIDRNIGVELRNLINIFDKMNISTTSLKDKDITFYSNLEDQIVLISLLNSIDSDHNEFIETLFYILFIKSSISYLFLLEE